MLERLILGNLTYIRTVVVTHPIPHKNSNHKMSQKLKNTSMIFYNKTTKEILTINTFIPQLKTYECFPTLKLPKEFFPNFCTLFLFVEPWEILAVL